ncbi:MAG: hypothetical protein EOO01_24890 [Chitinophagaceae bacterium]|nr:MAG: hypothetical protein EOO01_24890 [Chitinophagaceae bacterium]
MRYQLLSKTRFILLVSVVLICGFAACTRNVYVQKSPPGHQKKMHGSKSAKAYAPGQMKKH